MLLRWTTLDTVQGYQTIPNEKTRRKKAEKVEVTQMENGLVTCYVNRSDIYEEYISSIIT